MSVRHKYLPAIILVSLFCGGCTLLDEFKNRSGASQADAIYAGRMPDIHRLFRYYRVTSTLSAPQLDWEYQQASKEFAARKTAENQWRMAILLGIPGTAFYDSERSSTLFKELTNDQFHQSPVLNDAAYLMYSLLNTQYRLDKKLSAATERLNDSQSANKKMQEQLDAIKAIENALYQRNKAEETPKP